MSDTIRLEAKRLASGLAMGLALLTMQPALAQTAKERELEARVAHLEQLVEQLLAQQQAAPASAATQPATAPAAPASQPAPAPQGQQPIQKVAINTAANPGTVFSYGGFIKLDAMATDTSDGKIVDGSAGRLFYLPSTIPVAADGVDGGDAYTDVHAQLSRFWLGADHVTEDGNTFKAYIEADFFGGGSSNLGNEGSTNTHGITVRHAYVKWNDWLAGQTWSNFMDPGVLPDAVDFVGVTDGTIFVRQAQVRYSKGPWSFSLENPQTSVTAYQGAGRFTAGDNLVPDLTARWLTKGDWGHFSVAGLVRQLKVEDESDTGAALSVSGKFNIGTNDDIRYAVNAGSGIGRYLAFGLGSDVVLDADGTPHALDGYGGFVAWRHAFGPKLRGSMFYSAAHFDNDPLLTGYVATERAQSWHVNLIYSPFPKLDIGAELGWGQRSLEDGRDGDLRRVHTTVKYSF